MSVNFKCLCGNCGNEFVQNCPLPNCLCDKCGEFGRVGHCPRTNILTKYLSCNPICPVGQITCKKYEHISEKAMKMDVYPSEHRCNVHHTYYYLHHFEICPFPSQQG